MPNKPIFGLHQDEETGHWVDEDEIHHGDDLIGAILNRLDFCGCGMPETAAQYVHDKLIAASYRDRSAFWSLGEYYFFCYWADNGGLMEHGTSVPGWLTVRGLELLEALERGGVDA